MNKMIFVNVEVKDLPKSREFFTKMGYSFNEQFSDDTAACLVISEHIYAMLLTPNKFKQFINDKQPIDAHKSVEALLSLSCESKEEVESLFNKAIEAGGKQLREADDLGFMYGRSFEDLDGHIWELIWMDPTAIK